MPFVEIAGGTLHYRVAGSGPVAVFIHGFPLDSTMWADQLDRLSDMRRCIAVDLRGFGHSPPVAWEVLSIERHADDVAAVLAALDVTDADVVGLSMGGYVALAIVERHPHLPRTLALIDTRAAADTPEGRDARDAAARRLLEEGRPAFAVSMTGTLLAPGASIHAQARVRSMIEGTRYETIVAALAGMKQRPDRARVLSTIAVPAAVIAGEDDAIVPIAEAERMAAAIPRARFHPIPGAGHLAPMEVPDQVASALRTLFARRGP